MTVRGLCIGGPLGGQRKATPEGKTRFDVMEKEPLPTLKMVMRRGSADAAVPSPRRITYVTQDWHTGQGAVLVWVPQGQSPADTLAILLTAYETHSANIRKLST